MRFIVCLVAALACGVAAADTNVCINGRCGLRSPTVVIVGAQEHADHLAVTNTFSHCGRRGGGYEGIGFGPTPDAACRRACYWGQRRVREIGTAYCPSRRGWIAVVRYE